MTKDERRAKTEDRCREVDQMVRELNAIAKEYGGAGIGAKRYSLVDITYVRQSIKIAAIATGIMTAVCVSDLIFSAIHTPGRAVTGRIVIAELIGVISVPAMLFSVAAIFYALSILCGGVCSEIGSEAIEVDCSKSSWRKLKREYKKTIRAKERYLKQRKKHRPFKEKFARLEPEILALGGSIEFTEKLDAFYADVYLPGSENTQPMRYALEETPYWALAIEVGQICGKDLVGHFVDVI